MALFYIVFFFDNKNVKKILYDYTPFLDYVKSNNIKRKEIVMVLGETGTKRLLKNNNHKFRLDTLALLVEHFHITLDQIVEIKIIYKGG